MSWSFSVIAKNRESLKIYSRKQLLQYHSQGSSGAVQMAKIADHIDLLIDLFEIVPGKMLRLETSGHIDGGHGNLKVELNHYFGVMLE
jgi:hypothetical protein